MFGFVFGTVCLIALVKVVRGGRRWGGGWNSEGRSRWMLRRLFQRLDTTPGQEKVITEAFDEMQEKFRAVREEAFRSRGVFAKSARGEAFDTESVREQFERQQGTLEDLKKAALAAMQKIHEALTPEQRKVAGDLIEFGPRSFGGGCGGHRFGGHHGGYGRHHHAVNL